MHPSSFNKLMAGLGPEHELALTSSHSLPCSLRSRHNGLLDVCLFPEHAKLGPIPGTLHLQFVCLAGSPL